MNQIPDYFRYWGKAAKPDESDASTPRYHLLPYHCLDVAAVGWKLLAPEKAITQQLAQSLKVKPAWLRDWFSFCLMLHDIGKFCRGFQNLAPDLSDALVPFNGQFIYGDGIRHDTLGFMLWQKKLVKQFPEQLPVSVKKAMTAWLEVVCGHHGEPPRTSIKPRNLSSYVNDEDEQAATAFIDELIQQWLPDTAPVQSILKSDMVSASWQLAGVAVLADWLGSDKAIFHYQTAPMDLKVYWNTVALPAAQVVLNQSAFHSRQVRPFKTISQQFPFITDNTVATPLQAFAQKVTISASPQLFILEDVTGAGKTEAAMVLTHRLMDRGLASGCYVGLPTMATANAMYDRLSQSYRALYTKDDLPSLVLAHGASKLAEGFQASIALNDQPEDRLYEQGDVSATAYCNAWLGDNRKKALLADVGIGTIDQALLSILPARHQSLRILGLSHKVLLVDEVHAYDPYMQSLLEALLKAHAEQGGCAILLSATLPKIIRKKLVSAYGQGIGASLIALNRTGMQDYPLVTHFSTDTFEETVVPTRDSVKRDVKVQRIASEEAACEQIKKTIEAGQCICWIRNTVKDARIAYQALQKQGVDTASVTLFHSRFAMIDRQCIEKKVIQCFGKQSGKKQRKGQVLIATQVVEQSLDLDFDVMISDLAPIDLLIQRAGRLQRHRRDNNGDLNSDLTTKDRGFRQPPCLYLLSPDPDCVEHKSWLRALLPGTQAVYSNIGQLWLTARALLQKERFSMPGDARYLVESVYGDESGCDIPDVLDEASIEAEAEQKSQRGMGDFNQLDRGRGYTRRSAEKSGGWNEEVNIPTRLTDDTMTVVLAVPDGDKLAPYARLENHAWSLSSLRLPKHEWDKAQKSISAHYIAVIDTLKKENTVLKWQQILPLVDELADAYSPQGGWNFQ